MLWRDRELRSEPGETADYLPNRMLAIGHQIAMLRFDISALEEELR